MKKAAYFLFLLAFFAIQVNSQNPKLILPIGHTESVNDAQFSKDGKRILTVSGDKTGKIWDAETGQLLANLKGHTSPIFKGDFNSNGNTILTISEDGTAKLWNSTSGSLLYNFGNKKDIVTDAQFSKDGKIIFASFADSTERIFDTESGKLKYRIKNTRDDIAAATMNADNTQIATIGNDFNIRIWDVHSGKQLKTLRGHKRLINYIQYSPDGTKLISTSNDSTAIIWTTNGKLINVIKGSDSLIFARFSPDNKTVCTYSVNNIITLSDINTAKTLNTIYGGYDPLTSIEYSPTGNLLVTTNTEFAEIRDITTGGIIRQVNLDGFGNYARFNNDGTKIVIALKNYMASIWDLYTQESILDLSGHTHLSFDINFSSDGKRLVTANDDNIGRIWDNNSKITNLLIGHTQPMNSSEFSKDGKWIITTSDDSTIKIWDSYNAKLLFSIKEHHAAVSIAHLSNDNKKIISVGRDSVSNIYTSTNHDSTFILLKQIRNRKGSIDKAFFSQDDKRFLVYSPFGDSTFIYLGDTDSGRSVGNFKGIGNHMIYDAMFSPDSKKVITCTSGEEMKDGFGMQLWDAMDGHLIKNIFINKKFNPQLIRYSPDGSKIICGSENFVFKILDANTFKEISTLNKVPDFTQVINFSPDNKKVVMGFNDNTAILWDCKTGQPIEKLTGHTDDVVSAQFSPDGKYIITNSYDNTYKRWTSDGKLLYTFFPVDHNFDYLAIDSFGRYDGTSEARKLLYFTCGTEIIELEQFEELSWQPSLVSMILGTTKLPITAKKLSEIQICNNTPTVISNGIKNNRYEFLVSANRGGIGSIQLFINSQLRKEYPLDSLTKQIGGGYLLSIPSETIKPFFVSGISNVISVKATTSNGEMTSRGGVVETAIIKKENNQKSHIYIVSIGISQYKGEKLKLNYPSNDAESFASAISASALKLLSTDKEHIDKEHVHTYTLNTDNDSTNWPSKKHIQTRLEEIAKTAKADDVFILFFAGHGVLLSGEKNFYLLTAEASSFEMDGVKNEVAISTDELKNWMQKIKANKQLLILDACNSGKALEDLQNRIGKRDIPPDQAKALEDLKDKSGFFILAASASGQSAYEGSQFGHGLLTYSLLSGIKMGTGLKDENKLDVTGWFNNALDKAKELAKSIGGRQDPQIFANASFTVGLVDKEIKDGIQISKDPKKIFSKTLLFSDVTLYIDELNLGVDFDNELANSASINKQSLHTFIGPFQGFDAYSIRGSYDIKDTVLTIKVRLVTQNKSVGNEIIKTGTLEQKDQLIKSILEEITLLIK